MLRSQPNAVVPALCAQLRARQRQHVLGARKRERAEQQVHLLAETAARHECEPFAALGELVGELHRDAAAERLPDERRPLVPQRDEEVAQAARERAERVVAARLRRSAVPRQIGSDDREPLGERRQHVAPRRRASGHAVHEQQDGPGARLAVRHRVAVDRDGAEIQTRWRHGGDASRSESRGRHRTLDTVVWPGRLARSSAVRAYTGAAIVPAALGIDTERPPPRLGLDARTGGTRMGHMPPRLLRGCTPSPPATCEWRRLNPLIGVADLAPWQFDMYVGAEADGVATPEQLAVLEANPVPWRAALLTMLREAEEHLASARTLPGEERDQVVADLESERRRLAAAYERLTSERIVRGAPADGYPGRIRERPPARRTRPTLAAPEEELRPKTARPCCRCRGSRVASWRGPAVRTRRSATASRSRAARRRGRAGSGLDRARGRAAAGRRHRATRSRSRSATCSAGSSPRAPIDVGDDIGPGVRWLGEVAIWAVELTARGAMVPLLRRRTRRSQSARESSGSFAVRWTPALVDGDRLTAHGHRDAGHAARARPQGRSPGAHAFRAHGHGRRDLPRQRAPARGARAAAERPYRPRRRRGVPRATRRQRVRRAGEHRSRDRDPPRALGPARHGRARAAARAARPARRRRRVAALGVRARRPQGEPVSHRAGDRRRRHRTPAHRSRGRAPGTHAARAAAPGRPPAWAGRAQRRRGLGPHGRDRPPVAARRLRRSRPGALTSREHAVAAHLRRRRVRVRRRRQPARGRALVGACSTVSSSPRPTSRASPRKRGRSSARAAGGSPSTAPISTRRPPRSPNARRKQQLSGAEMLRFALGLEDSPLAGGISIDGGGWAADLLAAARDVSARTGAHAERLRGPAPQLPGRSARVARLPRRGRPRRLPRARHGTRQDADDARAPARRARATGPRW